MHLALHRDRVSIVDVFTVLAYRYCAYIHTCMFLYYVTTQINNMWPNFTVTIGSCPVGHSLREMFGENKVFVCSCAPLREGDTSEFENCLDEGLLQFEVNFVLFCSISKFENFDWILCAILFSSLFNYTYIPTVEPA